MKKRSDFPKWNDGPSDKIEWVLKELPDHLNPCSILHGHVEGEISLDNVENPETVLAWEKHGGIFIAGKKTDDAYEHAKKMLEEKVIPFAKSLGHKTGEIVYDDNWKDSVTELVGDRTHSFEKRTFFTLNLSEKIPPAPSCPAEFDIVEVRPDILESDLQNIRGLTEEIRTMWVSRKRFFKYGGGFCALKGDVLAGWCLFEYPVQDERGIGVCVYDPFKKKGVGTALAGACIEKARREGWTLHWNVWSENKGSVKLARKVGFKHFVEYEALDFLL